MLRLNCICENLGPQQKTESDDLGFSEQEEYELILVLLYFPRLHELDAIELKTLSKMNL